jgi:hypothetical protein
LYLAVHRPVVGEGGPLAQRFAQKALGVYLLPDAYLLVEKTGAIALKPGRELRFRPA